MSEFFTPNGKQSDPEKINQELQNKIELLTNELEHKTTILNKTTAELAESQKQYKQVLAKMVDLSQKPAQKALSSLEEKIYRDQLTEQAMCINTLQNRLWRSEKLGLQRASYPPSTSRSHYCANSNKFSKLQEENERLKRENKHWENFCTHVYDCVTSHTQSTIINPDTDDTEYKRHLTLGLLHKACSNKESVYKSDADYERLKQKYESANAFIHEMQLHCMKLHKMIRSSEGTRKTERIKGELTRIEEYVHDYEASEGSL